MKRTVSVIYTIFVVIALLGVIAFLGWRTYESRQARISDFIARTDDYTRRLSLIIDDRDVNKEVELAKKLMDGDISLVAVQVYSPDDGLRISVVKPIAGEFSRKPIAESDAFGGFIAKVRYRVVSLPMEITDMQGLEAVYVAAVLSDGEIRNNLLIILVAVLGLFAVTLVLVLAKPGGRAGAASNEDEEEDGEGFSLDGEFSPGGEDEQDDEFSFDSPMDDDFHIPDDFARADSLDETDLLGGGPEIGDSMPMDDDFDLPNLDDFPADETGAVRHEGLAERLESELERAASFNQDLSLLLFRPSGEFTGFLRDAFSFPDLIFSLDGDSVAAIEINRDLDETLAFAEDLLRSRLDGGGRRSMRVGIASRNGRLISASRLLTEAESALRKTDSEKNIVAFRSDPEKYREYLKTQEG